MLECCKDGVSACYTYSCFSKGETANREERGPPRPSPRPRSVTLSCLSPPDDVSALHCTALFFCLISISLAHWHMHINSWLVGRMITRANYPISDCLVLLALSLAAKLRWPNYRPTCNLSYHPPPPSLLVGGLHLFTICSAPDC